MKHLGLYRIWIAVIAGLLIAAWSRRYSGNYTIPIGVGLIAGIVIPLSPSGRRVRWYDILALAMVTITVTFLFLT